MAVNKMEVVVLQKENEAFDLRINHGLTFDRIAERLGYASRAGAKKAFERALERLKNPDKENIVQTELERLDRMTETYWEAAIQGNPRAAELVLQIMDKRLNYLKHGQPVKIEAEVINHDGLRNLDAEVIRIARVIEFIEGTAADITTLPDQQSESEPNSLEPPSPEGTVSA